MKTVLFKAAVVLSVLTISISAQAANVFVCGNDQDLVVAIDQGVVIYAETNFDSFPNGLSPDVMNRDGEFGYSFFVDEFDGTQIFYRIYVINDQIIRTEVLSQDSRSDSYSLSPIPGAAFICLQL